MSSVAGQSSAVAENDHFRLDERAGFRGGSCRQTKISPGSAGRAARPSGGSFHVWARELLANQREHSAPGWARCQFILRGSELTNPLLADPTVRSTDWPN